MVSQTLPEGESVDVVWVGGGEAVGEEAVWDWGQSPLADVPLCYLPAMTSGRSSNLSCLGFVICKWGDDSPHG